MLYLSGAYHKSIEGIENLGFLFTPNMGNNPDLTALTWAADTGLFSKATEGMFVGNHEAFKTKYLKFLDARSQYGKTCLFAAAPDKMLDPWETLRRSETWLPMLAQRGFKRAFVGQDGAEAIEHQLPWELFEVLFLGGSTSWKEDPDRAGALARIALQRGKKVHMGRVNSLRRWKIAHNFGCSTADGTFLAFGRDANLPSLKKWLTWRFK